MDEAVRQFLQRVLMMPSLIVIEDAHWLDDASAWLLRELTKAPSPFPWLHAITRRAGVWPITVAPSLRAIAAWPSKRATASTSTSGYRARRIAIAHVPSAPAP